MKEIMCQVNLFDLNQTIYLCEDENRTEVGKTSIGNISKAIAAAGAEYNVSTFHLYGDKTYAKNIAKKIKTIFKEQEIEVKIN